MSDDWAEISAALQSVTGNVPGFIEEFEALRAKLRGTLPPRLVELVRLRIAFHNQCSACMASRQASEHVDESLVCELEHHTTSEALTDAERAALRYADAFANNHLAIGSAGHEELREHFSEAELVSLGLHCALFVGLGRFIATWHSAYENHLPESYRREGPERVTPWGHDRVFVHG
jgi:alkylhydroperoxidase family enzyme